MMPRSPKAIIIGVVLALAALAAGVITYLVFKAEPVEPPVPAVVATSTREVIGASVQGRAIEAYTYGSGPVSLVFVGGIHGGYEWNSILLAYELMDHLAENPEVVPASVSVTVIPSLNPDGVFKVVGKEGRFVRADIPAGVDEAAGRFNANGVDLNRNFDCKWQPQATWRGVKVSAGTTPFSESEAKALRAFAEKHMPNAVVFFHSQANAVYGSECENGILPETLAVLEAYASAAGYPAFDSFDAYPVTGDVEGWLASIGVPAISVELATHESVEWEKNLRGILALFERYR